MSWSITCIGKPAAVKAALVTSFESAKKSCASVPHEVEAIGIAEQLVNNQLDFLATITTPPPAVKVDAGGHAYFIDTAATDMAAATRKGSSSVNVKVEPVYGFVE